MPLVNHDSALCDGGDPLRAAILQAIQKAVKQVVFLFFFFFFCNATLISFPTLVPVFNVFGKLFSHANHFFSEVKPSQAPACFTPMWSFPVAGRGRGGAGALVAYWLVQSKIFASLRQLTLRKIKSGSCPLNPFNLLTSWVPLQMRAHRGAGLGHARPVFYRAGCLSFGTFCKTWRKRMDVNKTFSSCESSTINFHN